MPSLNWTGGWAMVSGCFTGKTTAVYVWGNSGPLDMLRE